MRREPADVAGESSGGRYLVDPDGLYNHQFVDFRLVAPLRPSQRVRFLPRFPIQLRVFFFGTFSFGLMLLLFTN